MAEAAARGLSAKYPRVRTSPKFVFLKRNTQLTASLDQRLHSLDDSQNATPLLVYRPPIRVAQMTNETENTEKSVE